MIRTIGDPAVRFREDPVRMLRAVALAARLGFTIDRDTRRGHPRPARRDREEQPRRASLEEFYKVLRQGASRETFQMLHDLGLLAYLLPEADRAITEGGERAARRACRGWTTTATRASPRPRSSRTRS